MAFTPDGLFMWQVVTSTPTPIVLMNLRGYLCQGVGPMRFILPAAALRGWQVKIYGSSALWEIEQNANQQIVMGIGASTPGVTGKIFSSSVADKIHLLCTTPNLIFETTYGWTGNINYQ